MKKIDRLTAVMLAALLLFGSCSAGGDVQPESPADGGRTEALPTEAEGTAETEARDYADFVPEGVRYDGLTVRFLVSSPYYGSDSGEIAPAEEDYQAGEIIPEAVAERNNLVYEKLGVEVEAVINAGDPGSNWENYHKDLSNSVTAGVNDYDAVCGAVRTAYKCAVQQLLVNLAAVDTLDLSHPWWSQRSREAFDYGTDAPIVYFMNGDVNYFDNWGTSCVFFTKNFLTDFGFEMPYDLVREYKWTYDAMKSMSGGMYRDLDGDGKKSFGDSYGIVANTGIMERFLPAMGFQLVVPNDEGSYVLNETEGFVGAAENMYAFLLNDQNVWLDGGEYSGIFYRGDAAFSEDNLYAIRRSSGEMESDYGVLPYPMWDENAHEYGCTVSEAYATVCGISLTADSGTVGLVLDVMGAYSPATVTEAVIENGAMVRNARDEDTADMIRIIMDSAAFSMASLVEWGSISSIFNGSLASKANLNYASAAKRLGKVVTKAADKDFALLREPKA